ncbi:hypothetical protein BC793_101393 [Actinoplanes xinjiangensis]|jgi:hypothetical protein|uniref:Uncharacterized protein n=1 Tax=Actinoplanes xinjiangensis TaxID=512350 RepID=A0A316FUC5_9ACTN|nr:hypothetical protein BC793_101393 [Actinoplanes xinjiangensis]
MEEESRVNRYLHAGLLRLASRGEGWELPVFYRGPRAVITHHVVEVSKDHRRLFMVAEMSDVHIVRFDPGPDGAGRHLAGVSSLVAAVIAVPVVGPASMLLTVVVAGALSAGAIVCLRSRHAGWWQLRAGYRGAVVEVFSSGDEKEFAEFCRGLVRSLEYGEV